MYEWSTMQLSWIDAMNSQQVHIATWLDWYWSGGFVTYAFEED